MGAIMRVTFKIEGGAAHFPGLARPVEIDTGDLPPDEARELEERVRAANLFEPGRDHAPADEGAQGPVRDGRLYTITVEDDGGRRTAELRDPIEDARQSSLLALLGRYQRAILATSQGSGHR